MNTNVVAPAGSPASESIMDRNRRALRGAAGIAGVAVLTAAAIGMGGGVASAEPGVTDTGTTTANVQVDTTITLTALTPAFTLVGVTGSTVTGLSAVTMNVETNNFAGYTVTVQSLTATMTGANQANADSVPIGALSVRESGTTPFTPMSSEAPVLVHSQSIRSAEGGDALANDYQIVVPFVNEDTYTATLNYIATTL